MIKSTFDLESALLNDGYEFIIGIDEAGRGPLAGPVVAGAVSLRNNQEPRNNNQTNSNNQISNDKNWDFVRDSKTLSEKQREKIFDFVHEHFYVGVGICDHETIDRVNILEATYLAAKKALSDLFSKIDQDTRNNDQKNFKFQNPNDKSNSKYKIQNLKTIIIFDGNKKIPNLSMEQKTVVNGDKFVKSISAASIIAKVTRDRIMLKMHVKYPQYNFDKHKGYGTRLHFEMLETHGPCKIHRQSFEPVRGLVKKINK